VLHLWRVDASAIKSEQGEGGRNIREYSSVVSCDTYWVPNQKEGRKEGRIFSFLKKHIRSAPHPISNNLINSLSQEWRLTTYL
jgi:hypothetical protein